MQFNFSQLEEPQIIQEENDTDDIFRLNDYIIYLVDFKAFSYQNGNVEEST